jgi:AcrR family transcriptional regulator
MNDQTAVLQATASPGQPETRAPHERIVATARHLFCRDGIHATGIDRILAEAGASKMTLYARFGSKEGLLREVLQQEGAEWRAHFFDAVSATSDDPRARLHNIVAALSDWFRADNFTGCAYMNAVAEHTKGELWLRDLAAAHHAAILEFLAEQATAAGYAEPALLARQLLLLIDGMIAAYMVSGDDGVLAVAERNLRAILAAA